MFEEVLFIFKIFSPKFTVIPRVNDFERVPVSAVVLGLGPKKIACVSQSHTAHWRAEML